MYFVMYSVMYFPMQTANKVFNQSTKKTYSAFHSLWEEEPLVDGVDSVIRLNITLPLQQDWSSVQPIISPEHCEPAFFVTMDQGPVQDRWLKE